MADERLADHMRKCILLWTDIDRIQMLKRRTLATVSKREILVALGRIYHLLCDIGGHPERHEYWNKSLRYAKDSVACRQCIVLLVRVRREILNLKRQHKENDAKWMCESVNDIKSMFRSHAQQWAERMFPNGVRDPRNPITEGTVTIVSVNPEDIESNPWQQPTMVSHVKERIDITQGFQQIQKCVSWNRIPEYP